jgi:hypothetical protein
MIDLLEVSKQIVENFEKDMPIPTDKADWKQDAEIISLYLAALKIVERFG